MCYYKILFSLICIGDGEVNATNIDIKPDVKDESRGQIILPNFSPVVKHALREGEKKYLTYCHVIVLLSTLWCKNCNIVLCIHI